MAKCEPYCDNTFNVGCYSSCGKIVTEVVANMSGVWEIRFIWQGKTYIEKFYCKEGNFVEFNNRFNENAETIFTLIQPNGTQFVYVHFWKDFAYCESFNKFKIKIAPSYEFITPCDICETCTDDTTINCTR